MSHLPGTHTHRVRLVVMVAKQLILLTVHKQDEADGRCTEVQ